MKQITKKQAEKMYNNHEPFYMCFGSRTYPVYDSYHGRKEDHTRWMGNATILPTFDKMLKNYRTSRNAIQYQNDTGKKSLNILFFAD